MPILGSSVTISKYTVHGKYVDGTNVLEHIMKCLQANTCPDIDGSPEDTAYGWAPIGDLYGNDFQANTFMIGTNLVFSLRVDKKTLPGGVINKHLHEQMAKRLAESGKEFLSRNEKRQIKELVVSMLMEKASTCPVFIDVMWDYEKCQAWFMSATRSACDVFETLFYKSFGITVVPEMPYTMACMGVPKDEREFLQDIKPVSFRR